MIKMPIKEAIKSRAMLGGLLLIGLGVYLVIDGRTEVGMGAIANGMGIMGIRDK